ncbi:uncharacterized protein C7orf50 homolog isoform X1 [Podarcis raffonei]|uniref:uncharacterized protein C7orf50 homolog isoform X1 n=2 Tax=Lacertinae TaxID=162266 RepID=UPI00232974BE|nr:uncharacterized protein C7orf50 homolog isoform X1 [Podarcis raffonei]XP_053220517.1 uncharacterized protein C7orf50 homolog isoform X1 [Podarcis raffonei]XP_053220518.1 uncharacterized protein C7orf50 homolog isoform X1 [Podarcis raffonei]XP_053220519.1 uncharacterized protein C7orf50 homolog isoform X1 [Podarcis raffonei]XP_053220520.1 uncharacterized protein C7orf50 homolog isoform X1 [Podarcis raffonei]
MAKKRKAADMKTEKKKEEMKHHLAEKEKEKMKHLISEKEQQVDEPKLKKQNLEMEPNHSPQHAGENYRREKKPEEDTDEELSPEEKRTLERKLKKERKKEEKRLMREKGIVVKKVEPKKPSPSELALNYLTSWSESPKEWKFQKTRQTWLLLHMYEKDKVPDEYFSILLRYLEGLQGSARDVTVQKAEAVMKEYDNSEREDSSQLEKCERIRKVLQLLS